jgi:hypothetical protein
MRNESCTESEDSKGMSCEDKGHLLIPWLTGQSVKGMRQGFWGEMQGLPNTHFHPFV